MVKCSNGDENCKSFKILGSGIGFSGGRYVAATKSVAAKRAGSKLFQKLENDEKFKSFKSKSSIKFVLGETTKGGSKKTTAFEVTRKMLDKPKVVERNGVRVEYKYTYDVKPLVNLNDSTLENLMKN